MDQEPPDQTNQPELTPQQIGARQMLVYGTWAYYLIVSIPIFVALIGGLGFHTVATRLALAVCFAIAPYMAWRGNEGWKHLAGAVGLFLAMATFAGGCAVVEPSTRTLGFISLAVFLLACYVVKVFLINQSVKDFMPYLKAQRQKRAADRARS